ncbi:hypothetical protein [Nocardioides alcanivorans]|uniref:hypothetical protein n=1 Tax=Nocardioides alcanivorans TaxID=2897352 RepID=UPI001F4139A0|nr:hypothetical protein [Nocardioides alcanivorans]
MGFTREQASDGLLPVPLTPVLAHASRWRFWKLTVSLLLLRTALFAASVPLVLTLVGPGGAAAFHVSGDLAKALPWFGLGAIACGLGANYAFPRWLTRWAGASTAGWETTSGHEPKAPPALQGLGWSALWLSVALAAPLGFGCAWWLDQLEGDLLVVAATGTGITTLLALVLVLVRLPRHLAGFAAVRRQRADNAAVRAADWRTTAVIEEARFRKQWIDDLPVFDLTVRINVHGEPVISLKVTEYPCWAPAVGNLIDVWRDPTAPDDPDRMIFERRVAGQHRVDDPEPLRRPEGGSDGPSLGPLAPSWAVGEPLTPATRFWHGFGVLAGAVAVVLTLTATSLRVHDFGPITTHIKVTMAVFVAGLLVITWWWLWPWLLPRRAPRSATGPLLTSGLVFALMFALVFDLSARAVTGDYTTGHVIRVWLLYMAAGTIGLGLGVTYSGSAVAVAMDNPHDVDPAVVIDAIRSGDPQALTRLSDEHRWSVGPLHLK